MNMPIWLERCIILNLLEIVPEIEPSMLELEKSLQQTVSSNVSIMDTITHYIMQSSGKRLRPALFLISAGIENCSGSIIDTAASIELIHTASLVHDDIVDQSGLRRGQPTVNARWGNEISVLTGDYLFARAFMLLTHSGRHDVINILASIIEKMSVGEIEQLTDTFNINLTEEMYLDRIMKKTAYFFAGICKAGGMVRGAGGEEQQNLSSLGLNLGLAFQIKDDILDFKGQEKVTGKPVGSDLRQGIITLPIIHLLEHSPRHKELGVSIGRQELTLPHLSDIIAEMHRIGSLAYCENLVRKYTAAALKSIELMKDPVLQKPLTQIVYANSQRDF
jgi:heptaprenyl diphosphate synthase